MKIVIIGGVAGGATVATRLRRLNENHEIIIFEKDKYVSFSNCGLPYYCGDVIKEAENLMILTPDKFRKFFNIVAKTESEVISIDPKNKTVKILDKILNREYEESYDKLVYAPGASPIKPLIPGIEDKRIFVLRNLEDAIAIKDYIKDHLPQKAAIIGGGYIGIEMVENLDKLGIEVTIVEKSKQILNQLDYEMVTKVQDYLTDRNVELILEDGVLSFESKEEEIIINLESGKKSAVEIVILSIGIKPNIKLAEEAKLMIGETGGILVNEYLQTSNEDIYALGDAIEVNDLATGTKTLAQLAVPTHKQARIVADNISGLKEVYKGTTNTSILKAFDLTIATVGNSEKRLIMGNIPYLATYVNAYSHATYYPNASQIDLKLLFSPKDGKILGAQIIGSSGVDKRIDVLATCMKFNGTVKNLVDLELAYAPPYGSPKDIVNIAGSMAVDMINGPIKPISGRELKNLKKVEEIFILDVRTRDEAYFGKIENAHNIPLSELRARILEVPKDKKVIVYCATGKRSSTAAKMLYENGHKEIYNLNGGYELYKKLGN